VFASLFPGEASPTRVAAQVVSGIGFLGAGIIFREGLNVRGLNIGRRMAPEAFEGNQAEYLDRTKPERCGQPLQPSARDGGRFVERSDAHVIR
jgi:hypothetical protein